MKSKNNLIKGGEFIIKETKASQIFTPEDFTEEHLMMRDSVREFNEREVIPFRSRFEKKDYQLTESVMKKAGEMGFLGIAVPEEYGGMGLGFVSTMLVCDYISSGSGSFSTAFGAHTGIGTMPITLYGTKDQKQKYVPKLASGEWFGSYCLTEPGAGSDANSGKTSATLSKDGNSYKINGQKMWISNAGFCSLFIVFARIENDKNITAFIVENNSENGITMGEEEQKLGIRASSTRQVFFNDTVVLKENMLAKRGEGFKIAMNSLNVGRIKLGAAGIDAQKRVITQAVEYANNRKQFNTRISEFGAIKFKIAEMTANTYAGESACYRAAKDIEDNITRLSESGKSHQEAELEGVEDFAIECSILKVAVSEDVQNTADEGLQIFGGMGFSEEAPMESTWRDARIARIYEGTNEINRLVSVGMLLKKAFKKEVNKLKNKGNRLVVPFKNKTYSDYQAFRDNLSHKGEETYRLEKEFRKFFHSFKEHFKNHETTKKFFEDNVKVRFIKLPLDNYKREYLQKINEYKEERVFYPLDFEKIKKFEEKIRGCSDEQKANEMQFYLEVNQDFDSYVEKAEALCMGAFRAKNGMLPELNDNDETKGFLERFDEGD